MKRAFSVITFILVCNCILLSQSINNIDSLLTNINMKLEKSDITDNIYITSFDSIENRETDITYLINKSEICYRAGMYTETIMLLETAKSLASKQNKTKLIAECLNRIGSVYEDINLCNIALKKYKSALDIYSKTSDYNANRLIINILRVYSKTDMTDRALILISELEQHKLTSRDSAEIFEIKSIIYKKAKQYKEAERAIDRAIKINQSLNDTNSIAICRTNKGNIYQSQHNYALALEQFKLAYNTKADQETKILRGINFASALQKTGNNKDAKELYNNLLKDAHRLNNNFFISTIYFNLSCINNSILSENYLNIQDSLMKYGKLCNDYSVVKTVYNNKANYHYLKKDYKSAHRYRLNAYLYQDSLYTKQRNRSFNISETKAQLIALESRLDNDKLVEKNNLIRSKLNLIYTVIALAIIAIALIISVIYHFKFRKSKNTILAEQSEEITHKSEEIDQISVYTKKIKDELSKLIQLSKENQDLINDCLGTLKSDESDKKNIKNVINKLEAFNSHLSNKMINHIQFNDDYISIKTRINEAFPDFTKTEVQLCMLLKLDYTIKEIATFTNTSTKSVDVAKYRLRKKAGYNTMKEFREAIDTI